MKVYPLNESRKDMGAIVNSVVIIIGSLLGLLIGQRLSEKLNLALMQGIGLVILTLGVSGAIEGQNALVMILSIVLGTLLGEMIDIDARVSDLVHSLSRKFQKGGDDTQLAQGFLSATMMFCIGSMAIVGSLESGLIGDNATLYTKSVIDGITAILLTSSLGIGVILSSIPVLLYQGAIILFAQLLVPFLQDAVILEMTSVGSILLIGMGLNILNITEIKVMNMVPALIIPVIIMQFI